MSPRDAEPIELELAFQMRVDFERRVVTRTPRGERLFAPVAGGTVWGPRLTAEVVPQTGADYGLQRHDAVEDIHSCFMLRAADGVDIFIRQIGYRREADGYLRVTPFFDAPRESAHAWLNNTILLGLGQEGPAASVLFTYHRVL